MLESTTLMNCPQCGSEKMKNIISSQYREYIYIQCIDCDALVARLKLKPGGIQVLGNTFDSYLKAVRRAGETNSGRDLETRFKKDCKVIEEEFEEVLKELQANE